MARLKELGRGLADTRVDMMVGRKADTTEERKVNLKAALKDWAGQKAELMAGKMVAWKDLADQRADRTVHRTARWIHLETWKVVRTK